MKKKIIKVSEETYTEMQEVANYQKLTVNELLEELWLRCYGCMIRVIKECYKKREKQCQKD